jgi:hypothetical protein
MIRDPLGDERYWSSRVEADIASIAASVELLLTNVANPAYEPQYLFDLAERHLRVILRRYSKGDDVGELVQYFSGLLTAWERSNYKANQVRVENDVQSCRDWIFELSNLNHYNWCFNLVGLALSLGVSTAQWDRMVALIGGVGEDALLDAVIASRDLDRPQGKVLLHEAPYGRLLRCVTADATHQPQLLREFVQHWYEELRRPLPRNRKAPTIEPYWYTFGDPEKNPLSMGSYFGRWCLEAVAAVKAFDLDDSLCLGLDNYPGDLLRPIGPSTHRRRTQKKQNWLLRLLN